MNKVMTKIRGMMTACAILWATTVWAGTDLNEVMPSPGQLKGEVYQMSAGKDTEDLTLKMATAVKENQAWFQQFIQEQAQAGQPLPYHPNLGLTRDEYERMIAGFEDIGLRQIGEVMLEFPRSEGSITVLTDGMGLPIKGFNIHIEEDVVETAFARLTDKSDIDQTDPSSPTGPWTGIQWKKERGTSMNDFYSEKFAVGKLTERRRGIIYYDKKSSEYGTTHLIIMYDLPE